MDSTEILKWFHGRDDFVAMANGDAFNPYELKDPPLSIETLEDLHLSQKTCLGFYLMTPENKVFCSCLDFDDHGEDPEWKAKATTYYYFLAQQGLHPVMEVSSSGSGAHLWLFFSEAVPAVQARSFWKAVSATVGIPVKEIYPRQDMLSGEGLGNLIRFPLWNKSHFVDVEDDWNAITPEIIPTAGSDLIEVAADLGKSLKTEVTNKDSYLSNRVQEILQYPNGLLARRWSGDVEGLKGDKSRSTIVFCLAREMVWQRLPSEEIRAAMRYWMRENDYQKPEKWIDLTLTSAYEIMGKVDGEYETVEDLASCAMMFIKQLGKHKHMGCGIQVVDQSIDGIGPGEVCILAARPGHGKSSLALQWLDYQSNLGVPTLLLSAEMSQYELGRRMVQRFVGGDEEQWTETKQETAKEISECFADRSFPYVRCVTAISEVEKAISRYVQEHAVQLVAIDYLQLIAGDKTDQGRYHEVTELSRRIKGLARTHNIGILALCQVSREVDKRDSVHFNLSDMKESGGIEQDADLILGGYWHGRSDKHGGREDEFELHAIKRRNGPIRKTKMEFRFLAEKQLFTDG